MTELESTIATVRDACGPVAQHFVRVGGNYFCRLNGITISAAQYAELVSRMSVGGSGKVLSEAERLRQRLMAAVARSEAREELRH